MIIFSINTEKWGQKRQKCLIFFKNSEKQEMTPDSAYFHTLNRKINLKWKSQSKEGLLAIKNGLGKVLVRSIFHFMTLKLHEE